MRKISEFPRRLLSIKSKPVVVSYDVTLNRWSGPEMTIVVLADLHVVAPWTSLADVARVVGQINGMAPDMIVLGGDYLAGPVLPGRCEPADAIVEVLTDLHAPLGVMAILGNHDWHDCKLAQSSGLTQSSVVNAFARSPISLMQNQAIRVEHGGQPFWAVGFDSQLPVRRDWKQGFHRPDAAFAGVNDSEAVILLAHEPDYFAAGDGRADLQISGHTHGGQLNLFGWRPLTPSQFGGRYAYGHHRDGHRQMVVSGGLGFSGLPMRIGAAPEITVIRIAAGNRGVSGSKKPAR